MNEIDKIPNFDKLKLKGFDHNTLYPFDSNYCIYLAEIYYYESNNMEDLRDIEHVSANIRYDKYKDMYVMYSTIYRGFYYTNRSEVIMNALYHRTTITDMALDISSHVSDIHDSVNPRYFLYATPMDSSDKLMYQSIVSKEEFDTLIDAISYALSINLELQESYFETLAMMNMKSVQASNDTWS